MGMQEHEISSGQDAGTLRKQISLFLVIVSQFGYVDAQVFVANYVIDFAEEAGYDAPTSSNLLAVAQGLFALCRFIGGGLMTTRFFKPRYMLAVYLSLCFVFSLAATLSKGKASVAMLILVLSAESVCCDQYRFDTSSWLISV